MVKKTMKNSVGEATKYINRSKAIKKLQVSLKDFRRLCILKGVYPRDPPKKLQKKGQTYYHSKDINFLSSERVLQKFRDQKAHMRKVKKALVRGNMLKAKLLVKRKPKYSLQHLVVERYPSFVDALRDLDDPLCLINLVAQFPAHKDLGIKREMVEMCIRLVREFNLYVVRSGGALKKTFVSIKGVYYQAELQGQTITWIQPHQLPANLPFDVDYKVMMTFLEFYTVLLKFVNYRLYKEKGWQYPPTLDEKGESSNYFSYKTMITQNQQESSENTKFEVDERFKADEEVLKLQQKSQQKLVFEGLGFWINSEVPKNSVEFVALANGAQVYWLGDQENISINDKRITHVITDRKIESLEIVKGKEYVQPQWVFDSLNAAILLPVKDYSVGKLLPPHLSPFAVQQQYLPEREKEVKKLKGENVEESSDSESLDLEKIQQEEDTDSEMPVPIQQQKLAMFDEKLHENPDQESYGLEDEEEDDEDEEEEEEQEEKEEVSDEEAQEIQIENESESEQFNYEKDQNKKITKKLQQEQEQKELAKQLMSRKNQVLYKQMHFKKDKQKAADNKLKTKAKAIKQKNNQ